jgi:2-polyprenyl-3-methyl-5-hydroxy-6-metoxy-1,4-benzoquinol methylase
VQYNLSTEDYIHGGLQKDFYGTDDVEACICPLCNERVESTPIHQERGNLGIVRCKACELIYVNPRAKGSSENYHGDAAVYFEEARLIFAGKKEHHRDRNYEWEIREIQKLKPSGKLLDIGTNMGFFLRKCVQAGFQGEGVEPSPSLSKIARDQFKLKITNGYFEAAGFAPKSFDVITMIDVFEHVTNPIELLGTAHQVLADDGVLAIKVPNGNYNHLKQKLALKLKKESSYDIWDSYEHVVHYTPETMAKMAKKGGFKVEKLLLPIPIHSPVWANMVGHYYQYASPFWMDWKRITLRKLFHATGRIEQALALSPQFAPDLMFMLRKA